MTIYLQTDRLLLRSWKKDDVEPFARINSDPMVMEYMPRILTPDDTRQLIGRFEEHIKKHGYGMFAVEERKTGEFLGTVGICNVRFDAPFTPAVEIAWRLDYGCWGKGYATEAAQSVIDFGFNELVLNEIVSFTIFDNERSMRVMEKLGMTRDKKGDFFYPRLPKDHPLAKHCLYRISKSAYLKSV